MRNVPTEHDLANATDEFLLVTDERSMYLFTFKVVCGHADGGMVTFYHKAANIETCQAEIEHLIETSCYWVNFTEVESIELACDENEDF